MTAPEGLRTIGRVLIAAAAILFCTIGYTWITLPDVRRLSRENPTSTAFMDMRAAEARAAGKPLRKTIHWVSYDRISPYLKRAAVLEEDGAFWQHDGVDFDELRAAIDDTLHKGEPLRGASTITQQLAKNLYLSPERTPYRKLAELFLARRLEAELTKRRILELYLNLIEWGDGVWGAEAASRAYFGVSAADVSAEQAALLAGSISAPHRFDPAHPSPRLLQRQAVLLRQMNEK
jgi:monofunctional biosynthetic peptidoglycan transglycosylase